MLRKRLKGLIACTLSLSMIFSANAVSVMADEYSDNSAFIVQIMEDDSEDSYLCDEAPIENYETDYSDEIDANELDNENVDETSYEEVSEEINEESNDIEEISDEKIYETDNVIITFKITDRWNGGYNASVKMKNVGDSTIEDWALEFEYDGNITNLWNAKIDKHEDNKYIIKNAAWNQDIKNNASIEFGFSSNEDFIDFPSNFKILGSLVDVEETNYTAEYKLVSDWNFGFSSTITITNNAETVLEDWVIEFDFVRTINTIWNAEIVSCEGNHYVLKNMGYNANIEPNSSISFGFNGAGGSKEDVVENIKVSSYVINTDDEDGDGLPNKYEEEVTLTDPKVADTDGDGILDGDEDLDFDNLTNLYEMEAGTHPNQWDTDTDRLSDYDEIYVYGTDPLLYDTDGDEISDYDEIMYGFDPLSPNSKNPDGTVTLSVNKDEENSKVSASIEINVYPDQISSFKMKKVASNYSLLPDEEAGYLGDGSIYDFSLRGDFTEAILTYTISDELLNEPNFEPAIYYINEDEQVLERLENAVIDGNKISARLEHFSKYVLLNAARYNKLWVYDLKYDSSNEATSNIDVVFVIDSSGSMSSNDRNGIRKTVTNDFIDQLTANDRAAVISFSSTAYVRCGLTSNKTTLKNAVSGIGSSGGTSLSSGLVAANSIFRNDTSTEKRSRYIIFLTDGSGTYYTRDVYDSKDLDIVIHSVGLGSGAANSYLDEMARITGGQYFSANEANKLIEIFSSLSDITELKKDSDGDGISDYHEKAMARGELFSGTGVRFSGMDYLNPDSDGDGITDGAEVNIVEGHGHIIVYMYSNPTKKDTDSDDVEDKSDPWPLIYHNFDSLDNYYTHDDWHPDYYDDTDPDLREADYYDTVVIHHTTRNQYEEIKALEANEFGDGFNSIPYHFVIDGYGNIYEGCPVKYFGSHVSNNNSHKYGISLMGNFEPTANDWKQWLKCAMPTSPTVEQNEALTDLLKVMKTQFGFEYLGGHKDYYSDNPTKCPGETLENAIRKLSYFNLQPDEHARRNQDANGNPIKPN